MSKEKKQIKHKAGAYTFFLKPLPKGPLLMALSDSDRPQVPITEVQYAGGVVSSEPNPNDPAYLRAMETWSAQYNARLFRLCIVQGIDHVIDPQGKEAEPNPEQSEEVRFVYGGALSAKLTRLYWYADVLGNTAMGFMNLCMGQSEITKEGLEEAEEKFRPDSEGAGLQREGDGLPSEESVAGLVSE